ncbi:SPOR domain-containing protein [Sphingomonas sp. ID0503]|uniref:SPOR domain-containing protein n=1 Tax=Sphingomonas sp. ID0503 TaxID=3399691 RepID=UPI003AFADB92
MLCASAAMAQDAPSTGPLPFLNEAETSRSVLKNPADELTRNLRILAASPRNLDALAGAGEAALAVGDIEAALSFWSRAEEVAPRDGRVKAGLATAFLMSQQPRIALRLFDDAVDLGFPETRIAADRGLARDLRGDNRRAQRDYALALQTRPDDETTRRLATSLAISGDRALAIGTLDPLLRKQDMAAWRTRVFVAAMTGDIADASQIARQILPQRQAEQMIPFLARLANLRPAQKAAAVQFGVLPAAGKLREEVVTVAQGSVKPGVIVPATKPPVVPEPAVADAPSVVEDAGWRAPARITRGTAAPVRRLVGPPPPAEPAVALAGPTPSEAPIPVAVDPPPAVEEASAQKAVEEPAKPVPAKAKPKPRPKPEPEKPRIWVQVAGGANRSTLGREWNKLLKADPDLYSRRKPHVIDIGATNRLVVGPFASKSEAQDYVNQLSKGGRSGFRVESEKGQKVEALK